MAEIFNQPPYAVNVFPTGNRVDDLNNVYLEGKVVLTNFHFNENGEYIARIYNPSETVLTRAAARLGLPWCTGLTMLAAQAVEAESIWQDMPLPEGLTEILLKELVV